MKVDQLHFIQRIFGVMAFTAIFLEINVRRGIISLPLWAILLMLMTVFVYAGLSLICLSKQENHFRTEPPEQMPDRQYICAATLIIFAFFLFFLVLGHNRLNIVNADGLAYFKIARDFSEGNFVVRGYWSPLLSLMIVPFIKMGLTAHEGYRWLTALSTIPFSLCFLLLAGRFKLSRIVRLLLLVFTATAFVPYMLKIVVPDFIVTIPLMLYMYFLTDKNLLRRPFVHGLIAGLCGGVAFYTKAYAAPFVAVHLLFAVCFSGFQRDIRRGILFVLTAYFVLAACIAPRIIQLHGRYHKILLTTSGPVNQTIMGPYRANAGIYHECWQGRLCDKPQDALFPWEDPHFSYYEHLEWDPFESKKHLIHQMKVILGNMRFVMLYLLFEFGLLILIGISILIFCFFRPRLDRKAEGRSRWVLFTIAIYLSGYMLLYGRDARYYYIVSLLLFVLTGYWLEQFFLLLSHRLPGRQGILRKGFFISVVVFSAYTLNLDNVISSMKKPELSFDSALCFEERAASLKKHLKPPMAGDDYGINYLAYATGVKTYGGMRSSRDVGEGDEQINRFGIRTFVSFGTKSSQHLLQHSSQYKEIFSGQVCGEQISIVQRELEGPG